VVELLSPSEIEEAGYFDPTAISVILRKHERGLPLSEGDEMALVGVLSTQLLHRLFIREFTPQPVEALGRVVEFVGGE
jgi:asparagine synthase (glutamine-hydrolysing)